MPFFRVLITSVLLSILVDDSFQSSELDLFSSVHFQAYLQKLISLEKQSHFYPVAVRCMCALLDTAPHFNFRESLLASVVKNLSSSDDVVRYITFISIYVRVV